MDRNEENVKMAFFFHLDIFCGIHVVLAINLNDIFAATDSTTYTQEIPVDNCLKKLFSDDF